MIKLFLIFLIQILAGSSMLATPDESKEGLALFPLNDFEASIGDNAMERIEYHEGQIINGLIFIKEVEPYISPKGKKQRKAIFKCYCGREFETLITSVKSGLANSCGCLQKKTVAETGKRNTIHGLAKHPLYKVWVNMKNRCYNPNDKRSKNYGRRGITICEEWRDDFKAFYDWAMQNNYKYGLQVDRINNDGNYEPNNCRFATPAENNQNRRSTKLTAEQVIEIRNAKLLMPKLTQKELAVAYGVHRATIEYILRNKIWKNV